MAGARRKGNWEGAAVRGFLASIATAPEDDPLRVAIDRAAESPPGDQAAWDDVVEAVGGITPEMRVVLCDLIAILRSLRRRGSGQSAEPHGGG